MINRPQESAAHSQHDGKNSSTLLTVTGDRAKIDGKFQIADSLQIECEIGGELEVGGRLIIGQRGIVKADVRTVDALIMGTYEGNMIATGNVEIATTGRVIGNLQTDSLVIEKGGFFNGNVTKTEQARKPAAEPRREVLSAVVEQFASDKDEEPVAPAPQQYRQSRAARNENNFFAPADQDSQGR